ERAHVIRRLRIDFEIRHVVADPLLLRLVPPDLAPLTVPGFSVEIARRAVVHDATIGGPRVAPVRINGNTRWIVRASSLHLCSGFSPGTGVQPITAGRCAVVLQPGETRKLLAGFDRYTRLCVQSKIRKSLAVDLFCDFRE